jgi:hypothetical protein
MKLLPIFAIILIKTQQALSGSESFAPSLAPSSPKVLLVSLLFLIRYG